jgi:hypothetical protein
VYMHFAKAFKTNKANYFPKNNTLALFLVRSRFLQLKIWRFIR